MKRKERKWAGGRYNSRSLFVLFPSNTLYSIEGLYLLLFFFSVYIHPVHFYFPAVRLAIVTTSFTYVLFQAFFARGLSRADVTGHLSKGSFRLLDTHKQK